MTRYDIESVATVDARGQIVLPKSAREALAIKPGSKLAVIIKWCNSVPCCVTLMPTSELEERVREVIDADAAIGESQD